MYADDNKSGMNHYDEDLYCNQFFVGFQSNHDLFERVTSQRFMIAVPRSGSLHGLQFTDVDYETHTLVPVEHKPTTYSTLNGKELTIRSNQVQTGSGFDTPQVASVLFEEMFFNKLNKSYRVLCISRPLGLVTESVEESSSREGSSTLYSLEDCAELLWGNKGNVKLRRSLVQLLTTCQRTLLRSSPLTLSQLKCIVDRLFTKATSAVFKDPVLKRHAKGAASEVIRRNVSVALETYLMHNIYPMLLQHICTSVALRDSQLNKITRNISASLQPRHINIKSQFCENVPRARKELTNLSRYTSARRKLHCLRRVVNCLVTHSMSGVSSSFSDNDEHSAVALSSDDLLPILIYLVVKTEMPSWWTQFTFMSSFSVTKDSLDEELKFYLATLEAALQHVTSGQLTSHINSTHVNLLDSFPTTTSSSADIEQFFKMVIDNKVSDIEAVLSRHQTDRKSQQQLPRSPQQLPQQNREDVAHCNSQKCPRLTDHNGHVPLLTCTTASHVNGHVPSEYCSDIIKNSTQASQHSCSTAVEIKEQVPSQTRETISETYDEVPEHQHLSCSENNGHVPSKTYPFVPEISEVLSQIVVKTNSQVAAVSDTKDHVPSAVTSTAVSRLRCHPLCCCDQCLQLVSSDAVHASPDVYCRNERGFSALHVAAQCGHVLLADLLVNHGAVINASEYQHGFTPLHLAAQFGHQAIVVLLLHHNASSIGVVDNSGNTALHWATLNGHESCVKALIYVDQDDLLDINSRNDFGDTALHLAAKWGYEGIVDILLESDASVTVKNRKNMTPCQLTHNISILNKLSTAESYQLHHSTGSTRRTSVRRASSSSVKPSLSIKHCSVSAADDDDADADSFDSGPNGGYIVVDKQVSPASEDDKNVDKLLKFVADNDIQMVKYQLGWLELEHDNPELKDVDVTTVPLCHPLCQCTRCILYQQVSAASREMGRHVNSVTSSGLSCLHVAVLHSHHDMTRLLLRRGAHVNAVTTPQRNTALHLACQSNSWQMIQLLMSYGADVNAVNDVRNTPLHVACQAPQLYLLAFYLVLRGVDVEAVNVVGETPLHCAVNHSSLLTAGMLISCLSDNQLIHYSSLLRRLQTTSLKSSVRTRLRIMTWRCGLRPIDDVVGGGDKPGANHYMLPSLSGFVRRSASLSRLSDETLYCDVRSERRSAVDDVFIAS